MSAAGGPGTPQACPSPSLPQTHGLVCGCGQGAQSGEPGAPGGQGAVSWQQVGGSLLHPHLRDRPQSQAPSPPEQVSLGTEGAAFCQDPRLSWWPRGAHRALSLPAGHRLHAALPVAPPAGPATWPGPRGHVWVRDWRVPCRTEEEVLQLQRHHARDLPVPRAGEAAPPAPGSRQGNRGPGPSGRPSF